MKFVIVFYILSETNQQRPSQTEKKVKNEQKFN